MIKTLAKYTPYLFLVYVSLIGSFLQASQDAAPKICLTMIVKNESKALPRCLESVKNIVDVISICDTGSTDNTVSIIEQFMRDNNIPGKVHHHTWKNFGANRTLSVQAAQNTLKQLDFALDNTYLLLLDADMCLQVEPTFKPSELKEDAYLLIQKTFSISYFNVRLLRASIPWECVGVTHEYWASKFPYQRETLQSLKIADFDDGGCKENKYERDLQLLTQGLIDEPHNERYMFYLAQTYKCMKQLEESIRWYKNRIDAGGWHEELWYSRLMIGECYEEMGYWDQALRWYLEAYEFNPERAESLQKIATRYRHNGQNYLAYLFAKQGLSIPYPKNQVLFISHGVYDYQFDEELSIASYYTMHREEGFDATNRLLLKRNVPSYVKDTANNNMLFYVQNLKNAEFQPVPIDLPRIGKQTTEYYNPMNPSVQKTPEGYSLICRTVNYGHLHALNFWSRDPDDTTLRTRNFLLKYDKDFNLLSQKEIVENSSQPKPPSMVEGFEDCRLVKLDDEYWFTCAKHDERRVISQNLCKITESTGVNTADVKNRIQLKGGNSWCEKNWLPFVKDKEIFAIYSCDPFIVFKLNRESGDCETCINYTPSHDFSRFRGSAAPVDFDDGYLMLVHEVAFTDHRYYTHRFVFLDKNWQISKVSKPFTFLHSGIEYCCGMTIDHSDTKCILTVGIEDKEAYLCKIDLNGVRAMLEPLP